MPRLRRYREVSNDQVWRVAQSLGRRVGAALQLEARREGEGAVLGVELGSRIWGAERFSTRKSTSLYFLSNGMK